MTAIAFQTKLKSGTVHLPDIDDLIGKEVIITVVEIEMEKPSLKRQWNHIGDLDLNRQLDTVSIRDFAYE